MRAAVRGRAAARGGWQVADLPARRSDAPRLVPRAAARGLVQRDRRAHATARRSGRRHPQPTTAPTGPRRRAGSAASASETKAERIEIALEAQARYQRKVSWGVRLGDTEALFTHVAAPVMTRLRQPERQVLDTLVDAGVARSRSDALAWSVRLVGEHADEWLGQLRDAMAEVDKLRGEGPSL